VSLLNPRLRRTIGRFSLLAIVVNGIIGAGIFVLPATVAGLAGDASTLAYFVSGGAALLIALSFAAASSMFDQAGGPYLYAREAFGPFIGFEVGWMFLLGRFAGAGAILNALVAYIAYFLPVFATFGGRVLAISAAALSIGILNYFGVRLGTTLVNSLTVGKVLPLVLFVVAGIVTGHHGRFLPIEMPDLGHIRQASFVLLFALGGFEFATVPSEEVVDPKRRLPAMLVLGMALALVIYVLVQDVCNASIPNLASKPAPLASAASHFLGPSGARLMTAGAILSSMGTLSTILLVGPRMLYAMAHSRYLPRLLARVHPVYRTPHISIAVFALITLGVSLSGRFRELASLNALAFLLYSITTCAAVPVLRLRKKRDQRDSVLRGASVIPILGVGVCLCLLAGTTSREASIGCGGILVGAVVYGVSVVSTRFGRRAADAPSAPDEASL